MGHTYLKDSYHVCAYVHMCVCACTYVCVCGESMNVGTWLITNTAAHPAERGVATALCETIVVTKPGVLIHMRHRFNNHHFVRKKYTNSPIKNNDFVFKCPLIT